MGDISLSKKPAEGLVFSCKIWYNKKGDKNVEKNKKER